ncbi:hypothetical protein BH18ACT11_BH18ACT11_19220 [soil metagenome]
MGGFQTRPYRFGGFPSRMWGRFAGRPIGTHRDAILSYESRLEPADDTDVGVQPCSAKYCA